MPPDQCHPPRVAVSKRDCPSPHSTANKAGRVLWAVVWLVLFRLSPRVMYGWRRMLLRLFGARVGRNARISPSVRVWAPWNLTVGDEASLARDVDCYCVDKLRIGDHATVSQEAFLCTASHDIADPHMRLITAPIVIEDQAWVCARAYVAPGVRIGIGAVAGACAVVTRDVADWTVVAGNPARVVKSRELRAESGERRAEGGGRRAEGGERRAEGGGSCC